MSEPAVFRIRIQGQVDECWSGYFGAQSVSVEENQAGNMTTSIAGSVPISNSNRACAQEILAQEQAYLTNLQMGPGPPFFLAQLARSRRYQLKLTEET